MVTQESRSLCLTVGDADGIGPEIFVKAFNRVDVLEEELPLDVFGDMDAIRSVADQLGLEIPHYDALTYHHVPFKAGEPSAWVALDQAVSKIASNEAAGLVTGPIAKYHLQASGLSYGGHTEMLDDLARQYFPDKVSRAQMVFLYRKFRLLLLTRHMAYAQVPLELSRLDIKGVMTQFYNFLKDDLTIEEPSVAVLGLNPHAGEVGGIEEKILLEPILAQLNEETEGQWKGPLASDGFFRGFKAHKPEVDGVVAMYHDQGLIPMKILGGWKAVNVTIGLPFIRTSVSHGTAPDIAGKGKASPASLLAAIETARELIRASELSSLVMSR